MLNKQRYGKEKNRCLKAKRKELETAGKETFLFCQLSYLDLYV